jgi:hypothetical protein
MSAADSFYIYYYSIAIGLIIISIILLAVGGSTYNQDKSSKENKHSGNIMYAGEILLAIGLSMFGIYLYGGHHHHHHHYRW